ncbi:EamA family transporter [Flavobacterium dankookense]|uniref:Chloramphenicol-sensitive protein RarD n=1 Tax=Flavobacterium dankookense TaxID=706186 RepID=A0A4R6QH89_9FLAO|nr:EamA family transporter [Flavobacterium dankookense]TDP61961.1 chloramphenicol-sensitive protein RarD [Flavobacterium dankookense]
MQINKYYLSAFSAFIIWGFFSLALKPLHDYPSLDILFYRVFLATVLMLFISLFLRKKVVSNDIQFIKSLTKSQRKKAFFLTIVGGFLLILNWFLFIYAINHVSLQSASFAYMICPILTTILAFFILKEKLSKWQWLSVLLCVISCFILSYGHLLDLIYSVTIALSFAFYLISQRKNSLFDRFNVLTVQMIIASIVIIPFFPKYSGDVPTASLFYILLLIIVVVFTIIPLFLNLYALKGMNSSAVGILMYTNPLIHFILAVLYFKEHIHATQIVSYILILLSIVIFNEKILFKRKSVDV